MNERDRLLHVMQSEGMNAKQFCQEVGISQGTLSNIMGGRNKPSLDVLQAILRRFRGISCDWLIMGVGTMYINGSRDEGILTLFADEPSKDLSQNKPATTLAEPLKQHTELPDAASQRGFDTASTCVASRTVSKIMIFYSDGTFEER